ncbi:hypothetical protein FQR65_LT07514 [Abscondita terminalis]|nr:hypothetical protein FQR65_LT07514 [Abscondita terminalis]
MGSNIILTMVACCTIKWYAARNSYLLNIIESKSRVKQDGEPPTTMEAEKRIRREIANSNERRRMQSINAGFQSLRSLLPHHEGEKLSKAAILQQTAEYIYSLEQEKTRLLSQNCQLKRLVNQQHEVGELPPKKRKTEVIMPAMTDSAEEVETLTTSEPVGILSVAVVEPSESPSELRRQLDHERGLRVLLEEQIRQMEGQIYQQQVYQMASAAEEAEDISLQVVNADSLPPVGHTQTVVCSPPPSRSPSPEPTPEQRLPSVLEAAIKAEPKVEVERLPSPNPPHEENTPNRIYIPNTSRQNLETIVEAIRHLEGDHMFAEEPQHTQEVPLALTTSRTSDRVLKVEMNRFLEFHPPSIQLLQQSRPGVIVVKQES